jgi:hypothetical protein
MLAPGKRLCTGQAVESKPFCYVTRFQAKLTIIMKSKTKVSFEVPCEEEGLLKHFRGIPS